MRVSVHMQIDQTRHDVLAARIDNVARVDAMIGASRSTRRRACYRRIVLPFTTPMGNPYLVTASTNHAVDLRQRIA